MRDDVLIVLNEREPGKQQAAGELLERLRGLQLAAERIRPSEEIAAIIRERGPRIVVLDYLLGDFATALDVLQLLKSEETSCILWTDEPSAAVAVEAMKQGAADCIELGAARSIDKVVAAITELTRNSRNAQPLHSRKARSNQPEAVTCQDPISRQALTDLETAVRSGTPLIVLHGAPGAGRSTWARHAHAMERTPAVLHEVDWDVYAEPITTIFGLSNREPGLLTIGEHVAIDHIEFDTGELLEAAQAFVKRSDDTVLMVGTECEATAAAWARLPTAVVVRVPALADRKRDTLPLLQRFSMIAAGITKSHPIEITSELLDTVVGHQWPGNVQQLRSSFLDAAIQASFLDQPFIDLLAQTKERWERLGRSEPTIPSALVARRALSESFGNQRIAAARLGVGLPQLRRALGEMIA